MSSESVSVDEVSRPASGVWPVVSAVLFMALLALYVAFSLCLVNAPMQDLPNHLTRSHVISDLLFNHAVDFGGIFALVATFSPYLAGDLLLASLDRIFGTAWACRLWIAACIGLLPLSVWFVIRRGGANFVTASTGAVLALYVATDAFFIFGFTNFLLSVACALFAYGWFYTAAGTHGSRAYACFVLLLLLSYAMHLSALIFIIAMTCVSSVFWVWKRQMSVRRATALLLAPFLLLLIQVALSPGADFGGIASSEWGTWTTKAVGIAFLALRFNRMVDLPIFAAFILVAVVPLLVKWPRGLDASAEQLLVALALGCLYVILPFSMSGGVYYADDRALQYGSLVLITAGVRSAELRPILQRAQIILASIVALANLVYVAAQMLPENAAMGRYKVLAGSIRRGAYVLPIDTRPRIGRYDPFRHAGSYVTLYSHAVTPYLFAGDRYSHVSYFRYCARPYAPWEFWYPDRAGVSWEQVVVQYQYLLVTVPWDREKIPVSYTVVARNDVAELLELRK